MCVFVCVCMCIYIYIYTHTHVHTCVCMHKCLCVCMHTSMHICVNTLLHVYVCMYRCIYVWKIIIWCGLTVSLQVSIHTYAWGIIAYACLCVWCVYVCVCVHTYACMEDHVIWSFCKGCPVFVMIFRSHFCCVDVM